MARTITQTIPNLIQGISQRAPAQRDPSQGEVQLNGYSSLSMGLRKRPGSRLLNSLGENLPEGVLGHAIIRDQAEKYLAFFSRTGVSVFDLEGNEITVDNTAAGVDYLEQALEPSTDFRASTVADYTFLSCATVVPAMKAGLFAAGSRPAAHEALIWVKQAAYGELYEVTVNATKITVQAPAEPVIASNLITNPINVATIAALLETPIEALAGIDSFLNGGVIWLRSSSAITIKVPEALEGNLAVITGRVESYTQLPATAPAGYIVEVVGDATTAFDNYYLRFEHAPGTQVVDTIGRGFWREVPAPGIKFEIDPATMPQALVRLPNGTFYFGPLDGSTQSGLKLPQWGSRNAGDENTAPAPAFIGNPINDVFIYKNRMGMLAGERVVLSRTGKFFEFFPPTATRVQADDPIEIAAAGTKVSVLRHAIPFQDEVVLFSGQGQFRLAAAGGGALTPVTAEVTALTQFEASITARPVLLGDGVVFSQPGSEWAQLREFRLVPGATAALRATATEITAQVGSLIPRDVFRLAADSASGFLAVLSRPPGGLPVREVYVNKSLYGTTAEGETVKAQNSWSKWELGSGSLLEAVAVEERLYLVTKGPSRTYLEVIDIADQLSIDDPALEPVRTGGPILLDRWISTSPSETIPGLEIGGGTYDPIEDTTTWTLPHEAEGNAQLMTHPVTGTLLRPKVLCTVENGADVAVARGDWTTEYVVFGYPFQFLYRFSEFRLPQQGGSGGSRSAVRIQLRKAWLRYHRSDHFVARVINAGRAPVTYEFSPRVVDTQMSFVEPGIAVEWSERDRDGVFTIPLMGNAETVTLEIENTAPFPCNLLSLDWIAMVTAGRGGRGGSAALPALPSTPPPSEGG